MYSTNIPVTAASFFDRQNEIETLQAMVHSLTAGTPSWLAIVGPRKIGKTSLLLELARRSRESSVVFVTLDCFEELPLLPDIFRRYALRLVDGALGADLGVSLEGLAANPSQYRSALQHSSLFDRLPTDVRVQILELCERPVDTELIRFSLDLPEALAQALGLHFLVAWDEFQELAVLSSRSTGAELLPLMRSRWQRQQQTSYVISGSARTMITELVTHQHSPFFQHFSLMEVGEFERQDAQHLLIENAPSEWPLTPDLAERACEIVGGHPFYLQLLGEALIRQPVGDDSSALKQAIQDLLFSRTGRLALYFEIEFHRLVGRSGYLAKTLEVLATGPQRLSAIARTIHTSTGSTVRYLERLKDAVIRSNGHYELADPVFGLWLRWRQPGGTVVPMTIVGDEAEQTIARHLAQMGFDLIYQSRASRGAFDLLATRGHHQLGVQVKRSKLPLRFSAAAWKRMAAEGERFGWRWIVALVTPPPDHRVVLLDPAAAKIGRQARLDAGATIGNLLAWVDRGPQRPVPDQIAP